VSETENTTVVYKFLIPYSLADDYVVENKKNDRLEKTASNRLQYC